MKKSTAYITIIVGYLIALGSIALAYTGVWNMDLDLAAIFAFAFFCFTTVYLVRYIRWKNQSKK